MTQDTILDIYNKNYKIVYTYISWLKGVIKRHEKFRNEKFRIDVDNLSNYFEDIDGDSEVIYQSLKKILSNEGIVVSKGIDYYGTEFLTFSFGDIGVIGETGNADDNGLNKWEEKSLENNKLYNEETKCLICPECHRYSVEFSSSSDKDKYHIYKLWGVDALSAFMNESMKKTIKFVASYFKNCCVSKKDKCLYFDFFKEKEKEGEKEGKLVEIEGDVINERSEMGIVRRDARGE